jgi:hypothetical protein
MAPPGQQAISVHHAPPPTASARGEQIVDACALTQSWANALVIGDEWAVRHVLGTVWLSLKKPVVWVAGTRLSLPPGPCGTLILEDSDRLSQRGQADLLAWLHDRGRSVRVFTTSARPLFPLVETGSFLDSLYYRLNILCTVI